MRKSCSHSAIAGIFGQWLYADLPEEPSGETSWHSGFRRRLAADAEGGAAPRHVAVGVQQRVKQLERQVAELQRGGRRRHGSPPSDSRRIRPERRGGRLDVESPQAPVGRSPGAQPGHQGHGRRCCRWSRWTRWCRSRPTACRQCGHALSGDDPHPQRRQVFEIPPVRPQVTEYQCTPALSGLRRAHRSRLARVGATQPLWSECAGWIGLLSGAYRMSKRNIVALLADAFSLDLPSARSASWNSMCPRRWRLRSKTHATTCGNKRRCISMRPAGAKRAKTPGCGPWPPIWSPYLPSVRAATARWPVSSWETTPPPSWAPIATRPTATCPCCSARPAGRTWSALSRSSSTEGATRPGSASSCWSSRTRCSPGGIAFATARWSDPACRPTSATCDCGSVLGCGKASCWPTRRPPGPAPTWPPSNGLVDLRP